MCRARNFGMALIRALACLALPALMLFSAQGCSEFENSFESEPLAVYSMQITGVTTSTARLSWKTNKPTSSEVYFRRAASVEKFSIDRALVLDHEVLLEGLLPQSRYLCRARGRDGDGRTVELDGLEFTTRPNPPVLPEQPPLY